MALKPEKSLIFSQTLDAHTADIVRRIQGKHNRFATPFIGMTANDGTPLPSVRLEAWQNPETKLWQIDRFTRLPTDGVVKQEIEARPGLCFFDALYHLSRFQATGLEAGNAQIIPVEGERWRKTASYEEAAKAAGQIIDAKDGLARPCAYGRVLTGGFVADSDWEILSDDSALLASSAAGNEFLTRSVLDGIFTAVTPVEGTEEEWVAEANRKRDVINRFKLVGELGDALVKRLKKTVAVEFKTNFEDDGAKKAFAKSLFTVGIIPAVGYARGDIRYNIEGAFFNLKDKFLEAAKAMPSCRERDLCESFARSAETAFWLERATRVIEDCRKRDKMDMAPGLPYIERAAAAEGLGVVDASRLKEEYLAATWRPGRFSEKIDCQWYEQYPRDEKGNRSYDIPSRGIKVEVDKRVTALAEARKLTLSPDTTGQRTPA